MSQNMPPHLKPRGGPDSALHLLLVAGLPILLGACASFSQDGGIGPVQDAARQHLGQELQVAKSPEAQSRLQQRVAELLAKELTADSAVQIALFNNPGLQGAFHDLGLAEADLVQAGRWPNPRFSFGKSRQGDEREIDRGVSFDLARLIAMPLSVQLEQRRFAAVQTGLTQQMLALAAETKKAFYTAVAAEQTLRYQRDVKAAADAGGELAQRLAQVGNFSKLEKMREQNLALEAKLGLVRAERAQLAARERLTRLLGLTGPIVQVASAASSAPAFTLPSRLPDLPPQLRQPQGVESQAFAQRLDVQAARLQAEATAKNLGLSQVTRFVNVLEFGLSNATSNEAPRKTGWEVSLELPLFDWSGARVAKAEALYMQSLQRAAQTGVEARSELREAFEAYRSSYEIARHYRDEMVPLAKQVSEENLLRYNGMFISVFELLADARVQIGTVKAAIEAQRDFWLAQADLDMALIGKPSLAQASPAATAAAAGAPPAH